MTSEPLHSESPIESTVHAHEFTFSLRRSFLVTTAKNVIIVVNMHCGCTLDRIKPLVNTICSCNYTCLECFNSNF